MGRAQAPDSKQAPSPSWHALPCIAVEGLLATRGEGLTTAESRDRLARYGPNRLTPARPRGPIVRFLLHFHNLLLYIMLGAALLTGALGHWIDAGVLTAAVLINAVVGFIQEGRAASALDSIRGHLAPRATVVRDGRTVQIDAADLVPGDRVVLMPGDRVPADLRLVAVRELRLDESALTGESIPSEKSDAPVPVSAPVAERASMAYLGTLVTTGQASGIVVSTGAATELGQINRMLSEVRPLPTPLQRQVDRFSRTLAIAIMGLSVLTFALGTWWRGHAWSDMFVMVVALVAAAIPEGLPAVLTVMLALGVQRMARRHAIVRRLHAVESLGAVSVICTDKTGTLTRNEMTVQRVVCAGQVFMVSGVGYSPDGDLSLQGRIVDPERYPALAMAVRAGVLCNDARLTQEGGVWRVEGDPTEGALLVLGQRAGFTQHLGSAAWPRLDSLPFDSQHRFMATYHRDNDDEPWMFVKGAPERVLEMCSSQLDHLGERALNPDDWHRWSVDTAAQGLRLLALACKRLAPKAGQLSFSDMESGFVMLALVGLSDPPRDDAIRAIAQCQRAGIRVKMITGDHAETARVIGAQMAIGAGKPILSGPELDRMDDASLARAVLGADVFSRASPEHKLRLVSALQQAGEVVAMTGDGVNDAPALRRADIGVAMGLKGTDAARDAGDIVLADDNFASIVSAVHEGRVVYDNLIKFILFVLPTHGGQALVVAAAILFDLTLPLTPPQVLWVNLVTSITLGLALAFEPAEHDIMDRMPRPRGEPLVSAFFIWRVMIVSTMMMAVTLGLFLWEVHQGTPLEVARTMAVNAVVAAEMLYLVNSRSVAAPALSWKGLTGNPYVVLALAACVLLQLAYTYSDTLQTVFDSAALTPSEWGKVYAAAALVFAMAELEKWVVRRVQRTRPVSR